MVSCRFSLKPIHWNIRIHISLQPIWVKHGDTASKSGGFTCNLLGYIGYIASMGSMGTIVSDKAILEASCLWNIPGFCGWYTPDTPFSDTPARKIKQVWMKITPSAQNEVTIAGGIVHGIGLCLIGEVS